MSTLFVDTINEKTSGNGIAIPGHVVQVVRLSSWSEIVNTSSSAWANNQIINITPLYNNSLIYVCFSGHGRLKGTANNEMRAGWRIIRDGSTVVWNSAGSVETMHNAIPSGTGNEVDNPIIMAAFDSPNTTSQVEYKLQGKIFTSHTSSIRFFGSTNGGAIYAMEIAQ